MIISRSHHPKKSKYVFVFGVFFSLLHRNIKNIFKLYNTAVGVELFTPQPSVTNHNVVSGLKYILIGSYAHLNIYTFLERKAVFVF